MALREYFEQREHEMFRPCAAFSDTSRGRDMEEEKCDIRTDYQRDRDRIIHSKSFRRMKHKTQVFLAPGGDHYRTRLTHTLEVAQIARTIARALRLNEDLTEAIALGHDLGHTPFGHAGERALSRCCQRPFHHNEQSVRVVERLEKNGKGLNLTWEVRDGILNHKTSGKPATLEGDIVRISDKIAYVNHDIDDGIRAGILSEQSLPRECTDILGHSTRDRINSLIHAIVQSSLELDKIVMPNEYEQALKDLRTFMFADLYTNPVAKSEEGKAEHVVEMLFAEYSKDISRLPEEYVKYINDGEEQEVVICDYIAGMTDNYAVETAKGLFIPRPW
ncbi:MAG: deoxyguanosinetriphosphate triphosphohydrolase [Clostridium sp.]|nr:deoxyguanosinetriphosphate triphosphohydrolase [Clostridium sp.]MCM1400127.1 deoxyguanosinetriphosphate triphosphohydrolase [Clostridium sp.]MCM1460814.1 deoxyguanosinetriphosphate triphosphohydrolase [Bacteroides sp.]